jgi:hypothetical protein
MFPICFHGEMQGHRDRIISKFIETLELLASFLVVPETEKSLAPHACILVLLVVVVSMLYALIPTKAWLH